MQKNLNEVIRDRHTCPAQHACYHVHTLHTHTQILTLIINGKKGKKKLKERRGKEVREEEREEVSDSSPQYKSILLCWKKNKA